MKLVVFFIICLVYLFLTIIFKNDTKFKSVKKVRFDLDKNNVVIIPRINKTKFDKSRYGQDIIKNEKVVLTNDVANIQKDYVKKLEEEKLKTDEFNNIFKDQKPYWDSLEIDLNRSYDNYQVNNFNNIKNDNIRGKEISDVYNDLTYSAGVLESNLMHYDSEVMNDILY